MDSLCRLGAPPRNDGSKCIHRSQHGLPTRRRDGAVNEALLWLQDPPWDSGSYAKVVTRDATPATGAAEACVPNMRQAWQELFSASDTAEGRQRVRDSMLLCPDAHLDNRSSADTLAGWLSNAFDYLVRCHPCCLQSCGFPKLPGFLQPEGLCASWTARGPHIPLPDVMFQHAAAAGSPEANHHSSGVPLPARALQRLFECQTIFKTFPSIYSMSDFF